ncbi:orotidine 5'-phosphate decarboxylase / HUMPS family protein [Escherichia coli]|uniref:orotidine 5'-phosphate decarboxylase / HUMPS family protein n=1 Tax=Escherichia coli TaxID=562 RepID=UPI0015C74626|nr:orotidine 5'-phosphate decarboxylase / HUMPS family protein [Escherichia coli]
MSLPMLQVALDNQTMDSAYETTRLIAEEVDIIEVGTILCVGKSRWTTRLWIAPTKPLA